MPERRVMIDHLVVGVSDLQHSREFYEQALAPLGWGTPYPYAADATGIEFEDFIISTVYPVGAPVHVAFAADSREQVDAFHAAALAAGGRDNGGPGTRPEYSDRYYGAFVYDLDGNNVEAVFHEPA